jgi:hypothetical protein
LIAATVTITDGDGDQASAQVGIGDSLQFRTMGPIPGQRRSGARPAGTRRDPSFGNRHVRSQRAFGRRSATANFADNFILPADFGADGAGTVNYQLLLSANGIGFRPVRA